MGFAGSVIMGSEEMSPLGLTFGFLFGIVWRSLVFWVPIIGKIIALGHLWFLWNLLPSSLLFRPPGEPMDLWPRRSVVRAVVLPAVLPRGEPMDGLPRRAEVRAV